MRVADINVGFNYIGEFCAHYQIWNRRHTVMIGAESKGVDAVQDFLALLRKDGYTGRQVVRLHSMHEEFGDFRRILSKTELKALSQGYQGPSLEIIVR